MNIKQITKDIAILAAAAKIAGKSHSWHYVGKVWSQDGLLVTACEDFTLGVKSSMTLMAPVLVDELNTVFKTLTKSSLDVHWNQVQGEINFESSDGKEMAVKTVKLEKAPKIHEHQRTTPADINPYSLAYVHKAISQEQTRYALTGVCLDGKNKSIVGSDGKRLHFRRFASDKEFAPPFIINPKAVKVLRKIHQATKAQIRVSKIGLSDDGQEISFHIGRFILFSRRVEGTFPKWKNVIPKTSVWKINLDTGELVNAIKESLSFGRREREEVSITLHHVMGKAGRRNIKITTHLGTPDEKRKAMEQGVVIGASTGAVDALNGICFDAKFLLDAIWSHNPVTVLQGSYRNEPIVVTGSSVVMPKAATGDAVDTSKGKRVIPICQPAPDYDGDEAPPRQERKRPAPRKIATVERAEEPPPPPKPKRKPGRPRKVVAKTEAIPSPPPPKPAKPMRATAKAKKRKPGRPKKAAAKTAKKPRPKRAFRERTVVRDEEGLPLSLFL